MEEELTNTKFEGKAIAKVKGATAEQIWPFLEDFCNFHKWLPGLDTCYHVQGDYGQPGQIRYASATVGEGDQAFTKWAQEKLVMIDPAQRCLSYEIIDNNMGFKSYVATWKVIPVDDDDDDDDQARCKIEWSFVASPIDGMKNEDFLSYVEVALQGVVERMEKAVMECTCN